MFGNLGIGGHPPPTAEDLALSRERPGYWVNFASQGNPNDPGLPHRPALTSATRLVMRIGRFPEPTPISHLNRLKVRSTYSAGRRAGCEKNERPGESAEPGILARHGAHR